MPGPQRRGDPRAARRRRARRAVPRAGRGLRGALRPCARVDGEVVVLDLRDEERLHAGNRFLIYALFTQARVSVHVLWGRQQQNTVLAVGKSIVDRSSPADIGALMLRFGGGGHRNAGTCQIDHGDAAATLATVVAELNAAGRPVAA